MACVAASRANQVGYTTHPHPWAAPSGPGVVIDDKSWQPWYNYYSNLVGGADCQSGGWG